VACFAVGRDGRFQQLQPARADDHDHDVAFFQVGLQHRLKILAGSYRIDVDEHLSLPEGPFKSLANAARIGLRI
jgi:hypothetical protein